MGFKKELGPLILVVGVAVWSVWLMVRDANLVTDYGNDGVLITWIMNQPLWSFEGNIFAPHTNVLAYSDMHKLSGFLSGGNFAHSLILGQVTSLLIIYLWWRKLFGNGWAAAIGVVAFGLSQIRWEYQVHLQMWNLQYALLGSWLISSGLTDRKNWKVLVGSIVLGLQIYESPLPILFAVTIVGSAFWFLREKINFKVLILSSLIALSLAWPGIKVYRDVSAEFSFARDIREAAHNSLSVNDLWGSFASPGMVAILFAALMLTHTKTDRRWKFLFIIFVLGIVMALGPVLKWQGETVKVLGHYPVPLPYALAYYMVPGMEAMRTPSRWLWLSGFAASGLIAYGLKDVRFKATGLKLWLVIMVAVLGGTHLTKVRSLPQNYLPVYGWLQSQPGKTILEVPVYAWPHEQAEIERMYYSLNHGKTLVNGYSGFTPPFIYALVDDPISQIPDEVDYLVSHDKALVFPGKIIYEDEEATVYSRP